jgi:hypothetical protein
MQTRMFAVASAIASVLTASTSFGQPPSPLVTHAPPRPVYVTNFPDEGEIAPIVLPFVSSEPDFEAGAPHVLPAPNFGFTVPEGMRLVVEYIDAEFYVDNPNNTADTSLALVVSGGTPVSHHVGASQDPYRCTATQVCFPIHRQLKTYVEAGNSLSLYMTVSLENPATVFALGSINGYLEATPSQ